jgi:hypothetical protein
MCAVPERVHERALNLHAAVVAEVGLLQHGLLNIAENKTNLQKTV